MEVTKKDRSQYFAEYREAHREKYRAYAEERYASYPEYKAAWYVANREKQRGYAATYRDANPEKVRAMGAKYRAVKCSATIGDPQAITAIYRRARENKRVHCYLCGELIPMGQRHVDHIMPLSKGGSHTASNLAIACAHCNMSKNAKMPSEVGVLL
jgi:hypothetical protein